MMMFITLSTPTTVDLSDESDFLSRIFPCTRFVVLMRHNFLTMDFYKACKETNMDKREQYTSTKATNAIVFDPFCFLVSYRPLQLFLKLYEMNNLLSFINPWFYA